VLVEVIQGDGSIQVKQIASLWQTASAQERMAFPENVGARYKDINAAFRNPHPGNSPKPLVWPSQRCAANSDPGAAMRAIIEPMMVVHWPPLMPRLVSNSMNPKTADRPQTQLFDAGHFGAGGVPVKQCRALWMSATGAAAPLARSLRWAPRQRACRFRQPARALGKVTPGVPKAAPQSAAPSRSTASGQSIGSSVNVATLISSTRAHSVGQKSLLNSEVPPQVQQRGLAAYYRRPARS